MFKQGMGMRFKPAINENIIKRMLFKCNQIAISEICKEKKNAHHMRNDACCYRYRCHQVVKEMPIKFVLY